MNITIKDLDRWGACSRGDGNNYSDERLKKLLRGRESVTPLEVLRMRSVPVQDRIWALLRPDVLGAEFLPVVSAIADRAVRRYCLKCGVAEVEQWAAMWLSGENRSGAAANGAAWAAADAAARTARTDAAAWAAAWEATREATREPWAWLWHIRERYRAERDIEQSTNSASAGGPARVYREESLWETCGKPVGNLWKTEKGQDMTVAEVIREARPALQELQAAIYSQNRKNGYYRAKPRDWHSYRIPALLALCISELTKALDAWRRGDRDLFREELADTVMRVLDLAEGLGIELGLEIQRKAALNETKAFSQVDRTREQTQE